MRRKAFDMIGFGVLTLCLVLVSAFCITGTVMSCSNSKEWEMELYDKEQELVRDTREYLNQSGFVNSGVMLTSVMDENGMRWYTVTVHHGKIDRMDEDAKKNLKEQLATLVFAEDNCNFSHEFLVTD